MKITASKIFHNFEEYFLVWTLAFNVVIIFFQVVMRYCFANSLTWTEEVARYIFVWQAWIGASYGVKRSGHIRVEALAEKFKGKNRILFDIFIYIIWMLFMCFLAYTGTQLTLYIAETGQLSPANQIPMEYVDASVVVGSVLMIWHLLQDLCTMAKQYREFGQGAE